MLCNYFKTHAPLGEPCCRKIDSHLDEISISTDKLGRLNQEFGFSIIDSGIVQRLIATVPSSSSVPRSRNARNYLSVGACVVPKMEGLRVSLHDEELVTARVVAGGGAENH